LKTALGSGGQSTENLGYLYDPAWNLNKRTNNGSVTTFTVNNLNQVTNDGTWTFSYDYNGNLVQQVRANHKEIDYTYDDENQLVRVATDTDTTTSPWRTDFVYDGRMRLRVRKDYTWSQYPTNWVLSAETHYVYDGMVAIQERNGSNVPLVSYTRGTDLSGTFEDAGGIGGLLARSHGYSSGSWTNHNFYHADGNGNITAMVGANQTLVASYRYDPYGRTTYSSGTLASANVYRFSSKPIHANSGLYYYGYRFYWPELQRWLDRDPVEELAGINLYAFVGNEPIGWLDPLGLDRASCLRDCFDQLAGCLSPSGLLGVGVSTAGGAAIGGHATRSGAQKWLCRAGTLTRYGRALVVGSGVGFIFTALPWVTDCYSSYLGCRSGCPKDPCPSAPITQPSPPPPMPLDCNQNAPPNRLIYFFPGKNAAY
jgi:RHS repeat-associated protein